jgi:hypothetical protein
MAATGVERIETIQWLGLSAAIYSTPACNCRPGRTLQFDSSLSLRSSLPLVPRPRPTHAIDLKEGTDMTESSSTDV